MVLVQRKGCGSWRARYKDPDSGRDRFVTLDPQAAGSRESRRRWALDLSETLLARRLGMQPANVTLESLVQRVAALEERVALLSRPPSAARRPADAPSSARGLWVYVLRCTSTGLYKIGKSRDPVRRLVALQTGASTRLVEVVTVFDPIGDLESILHERFALKRADGEWFRLADDDEASLRDLGVAARTPGTTVRDLLALAHGRTVERATCGTPHLDEPATAPDR